MLRKRDAELECFPPADLAQSWFIVLLLHICKSICHLNALFLPFFYWEVIPKYYVIFLMAVEALAF